MMTLVDQALANITLLLSFMLFSVVFARLLKNKKVTINHVLDALLAIGYSGIAILILCSKHYQANMPMIIILTVLIIKYLRCDSLDEARL